MLNRRRALSATAAAAIAATLPLGAIAHGPTRQKASEKITIDAPAAKVWGLIRDFGALQAWHPAVAESPASKGNEEGSVREIKLKGGGALTETLEAWDGTKMRYTYRAKDGGALPVANYSSTITVTADGDRSVVEWRGGFYRASARNDPPPEANDEAAVKAVTGVYQSGLANLKKIAEAK